MSVSGLRPLISLNSNPPDHPISRCHSLLHWRAQGGLPPGDGAGPRAPGAVFSPLCFAVLQTPARTPALPQKATADPLSHGVPAAQRARVSCCHSTRLITRLRKAYTRRWGAQDDKYPTTTLHVFLHAPRYTEPCYRDDEGRNGREERTVNQTEGSSPSAATFKLCDLGLNFPAS